MPAHIAVVGAGAFGGWTALHLLRAGHRVTLIDAWGPGNSRSSSGDETRVVRCGYGPNAVYTRLTARAIKLWRDNEQRWRLKLFHNNGVLWFSTVRNEAWDTAALQALRDHQLPFESLRPDEAARRFPQIHWDGVLTAVLEQEAGFVLARRACQAVFEGFLAENGTFRQAHVQPGLIAAGRMAPLRLNDGSTLAADHYVFAAGPWLAGLFSNLLGRVLTPTRQDVFYFGTPPGDSRFDESNFPAWIDNSATRYYGIPGNQWRGFKVADDTPGPAFDPTSGERVAVPAALAAARAYLARRFPALAQAPLSESRVCQYEMSADGHLIAAHHPEASNTFLLGGGSGHGFKFSPALGEQAARWIVGESAPPQEFSLDRYKNVPVGVGERK
jgi:glycine/D-amino acid oxidase-like deaminating enzyme